MAGFGYEGGGRVVLLVMVADVDGNDSNGGR